MNFNYPDLTPRPDSEQKPAVDSTIPRAEHTPATPKDSEPMSFWYLIARFLSWALLPVLAPVYGIVLIFRLSVLTLEPAATKWAYVAIVFGICTLLPILCGLILKKLGIVSDTGLNKQNERTIPYIVTILTMICTMAFLMAHGMPMWVNMFFAGGALAGLICLLVNFRWKISAHAAGMGGLTAMLFILQSYGIPQRSVTGWIVATIIASGALGSARLFLRRHTLMQVLAGYGVGLGSVLLLSYLAR